MHALAGRRGFISHCLAAAMSCMVLLTISSDMCTRAFVINGFAKRPEVHNLSRIYNGKDIASDIPKEGVLEDEWDGVPIEGAHDEEHDTGEDDAFVPSIGFMSIANSIPSPAFDETRFSSNAGKLHQQSDVDTEPDEEHLLDMGGDPFFLEDEWDGVPIEGAHDEEFEPGSNKIDAADMFVPSTSFMSMANSVPSPVIGTGGDFDPLRNMGKLHKAEVKDDVNEDDLLEMGGDPFFLEDGEREESDRNMLKVMKELDEPNDFEWDGMIDEDAHFDFD